MNVAILNESGVSVITQAIQSSYIKPESELVRMSSIPPLSPINELRLFVVVRSA